MFYLNQEKKQYYIAPLLPATAIILSIYQLINNHWFYFNLLILILSFLTAFLVTIPSVYFLNDKNLFDKSRFHTWLKKSKDDFIQNAKVLKLPPSKISQSKKHSERVEIEVIYLSQRVYPSDSMLFLGENCKKAKVLKLPPSKISQPKKRSERVEIEVIYLYQRVYPSNSMLFLGENCKDTKVLKLPPSKISQPKKRSEIVEIEVIYLSQRVYPSSSMLFLAENCKSTNELKNNKSKLLEGVTKFENIVLTKEQLEMIKLTFLGLKKTIIRDENTLEDFIIAIKSLGLRRKYPFVMLELQSQYCAEFLRLFFIPFVELLTGNKLDRKEVSILFMYKMKNGFKELKEDSISKKSRQLSTGQQRETYKVLLEKLKNVG